jgi:hypothetical protein
MQRETETLSQGWQTPTESLGTKEEQMREKEQTHVWKKG